MTSTQITPTGHHTRYRKCILDLESTSFQPWLGRIICIGLKDVDSGEIKIFQDEYEETVLLQFFKYFNKSNYNEIIGFNISYDLRYIFAKCLRYKIPANGFFSLKQTDIMIVLKNVGIQNTLNKPGTLNEWTKSILGKQKTFQNHQIPDLYLNNRIKDIIKYNINDLELTYELWQRIHTILGDNF